MTDTITTPIAEEVPVRPAAAPRRRGRRARELHVLLVVLAFLVLVAVVPSLVTWHDPYELDGLPFTAPDGEFWFGTDEIGRDLFSRVVHGLRISLFSLLLAVAVALAGGAVIGVLSGLAPGGLLDRVLGVLTEAIMAIPAVLLALAVITTYGRGAFVAAVAIGIGEATGFARLIRGCVIQSGTLTYVEAARTCGAGPLRVITRHIIPSTTTPSCPTPHSTSDWPCSPSVRCPTSVSGCRPVGEWGVLIAG